MTLGFKHYPIVALATSFALSACSNSVTTPFSAASQPSQSYQLLMQDILIHADLWTERPEILSAGYGFDGILGIPGGLTEEAVRAAGGAWNTVTCSDGRIEGLTSAASINGITFAYGFPSTFGDGLPVVFSWPVLPSSVDREDFEVHLNTGDIVIPDGVSIIPNQDFNERNTVVLVSPGLGNRLLPSEPGAIYPTEVRIVSGNSPLMLVGPQGPVSAVGLIGTGGHPYISGPFLVGAKLSRMNAAGDDGPMPFSANTNGNDGISLYGAAAQYRLRVLTSGGFSPDGVQAVRPDEFERYFQLQVRLDNGSTQALTQTGVVYDLDGSSLEIVGLAELGQAASSVPYDDCYIEDGDNQIDIILAGDEAAMRKVSAVIIPATDNPFFNPGGPGRNPVPGINYTAPGPFDVEPVTLAIDDPKVVNFHNR